MWRRLLRQQKGQSVAEMAVAVPVVIFIIMAMLAVGFYLYAQILMCLAANQGGRLAGVLYGDPAVTRWEADQRIRQTSQAALQTSTFLNSVTVTVQQVGDDVEVQVQGDYNVPVPWVAEIFGGGKAPVRYKSTYLIEWKG